LKLSKALNFLEYHYQKYEDKAGINIDFLEFVNESLHKIPEEMEPRNQVFKDWIESKKKEIDQQSLDKIQWHGSPALFGYIFSELIKNGFIQPPLFRGETNYAGFAKLCYKHFNVNNTTIENLIKEMNPEKNTLTNAKRAKFPNLSDLA
jgi:hypothetical protein